jgi:hypothetical protein
MSPVYSRPGIAAPAAAVFIVMLLAVVPAAAHPPSAVSVSYNQLTAELTVSISHPVENQPGHYIKEVTVTVNGNVVNDSVYTGQPGTDPFTYTFSPELREGDIVRATAVCSQFGSGSGSFIMHGNTATIPSHPGSPAATRAAGPEYTFFASLAGAVLLMKTRSRGGTP